MLKILAPLTALFFTTAAAAGAPGMALDSILINGDTVRIDVSSKIRGCGYLVNEFGIKIDAAPICRNGEAMVLHADIGVRAGEKVRMCNVNNRRSCTGFVQVREVGDVNGDLRLDVLDLMLMHRYIMGLDTGAWPTVDADLIAGDFDEDGDINVIDILFLIEMLDLD
jgi:hypothetical protein